MRESILGRLARLTVRSWLKPALQPTFPIPVQRHWASIATRAPSVPFGVRFSQSSLAVVPTEILRSKSNLGSEGAELFLHGGAFMIGSPVNHRSITGRLAKRQVRPFSCPNIGWHLNAHSQRRWMMCSPVTALYCVRPG